MKMPPKKKRKAPRSVPSNADPGVSEQQDTAAVAPPPNTATATATSTTTTTISTTQAQGPDFHPRPEEHIQGFTSQQELAKHAISLGLKRVLLADLHQQSDLQNGYIGGQVMGHCSLPLSQGHDLNIFIQDESTTEGSQSKHLRVTIQDQLAEKLPVLREDAKLFLYRPEVKDDAIEVSQDHGKCLVVGTETLVWIVHRDVRKPHFFSEKSCGKKWWGRTKKRRKKMQAMW